jgi:predicted porin
MKKSLLALAVAAFSGAAFAQSSVTLFGVVDTGVSWYKGDGGGRVVALSNSGLNSSRLGVRGTEDLGSGLKANFWFEGSVNTDNGTGSTTSTNNQFTGAGPTVTYAAGTTLPSGAVCTPVPPATTCLVNVSTNGSQGLTFNRRMFVGLSGGFGELRLGRDYTPLFWQITNNDPFGTNGVGDTNIYGLTGLTGAGFVQTLVRASNAIEYFTPPGIGGLYLHAMYAFGENLSSAANADDGRTVGGRIGWAGGPVDFSIAYNKVTLQSTPAQGSFQGLAASLTLTFGNFKPMAQYVKNKVEISAGTKPETDNWMVGIVMTFGPTDLRMSYNAYNVKNSDNDGQKFAIGPVYNLSRRTAVYATYALADNKGNGTLFNATSGGGAISPVLQAGGKSQGFDMGIRHAF